MNYIICHYAEIGLKGKNRKFFEKQLVENLKKSLTKEYFQKIKRLFGRILIELPDLQEEEKKQVEERIKNVFGVANFSWAKPVNLKMKNIKEAALELLAKEDFKTFRITTKRSNKDFPLNSQEISTEVGAYILDNLPQKKVDLEEFDANCFIEITNKKAFLYLNKISGPGGLPVRTGGKAVSLLSGGIDSPVASWKAMSRGTELIFVHFHAFPYTSKKSIEKVKKLVRVLNKYQFHSKLYLVPFGNIQKKIVNNTQEKYRIILYRRLMIRIASRIADQEEALALFTGEAVGQVSSQTLENINVISQATDYPILRPLISDDKEEVIKKAQEIETYQISIQPEEDTCSRFQPDFPVTKAKLKPVQKEEDNLDVESLINEVLQETKILTLNFPHHEFQEK